MQCFHWTLFDVFLAAQKSESESISARLQQEKTDLQNCLDTTTQEVELLRAEL